MGKDTPKEKPAARLPEQRNVNASVGLIQFGANMVGAFLCTFYFMVLDQGGLAPDFNNYLWITMVMTAGLAAGGWFASNRWAAAISKAWSALRKTKQVEAGLLEAAQRKVLLAPLFFSLLSFVIWSLAAVIMASVNCYQELLNGDPGYLLQAARVFIGTILSGSATATVIYFSMDRLFRGIRPYFFTQGGLTQVRGVFRLRLRTKLRFAFLMVSLVPMVVVAILSYERATVLLEQNPETAMQGLAVLLAFVVAAGMGLVFIFSHLVSASIADPVREMEQTMKKVKHGDLSAHVTVTDNDELGALGDSFNRMIEGLRERDRVKETFGRFVSPQIASTILDDQPELGGENTEVTVLFSDIRNYTNICEQLAPAQVIELLNNYFAYMVEAVEKHQGLVYQFVGDGIMAVFGAPVKLPDHATCAVESGLGMLSALDEFNARHRSGQEPLSIGIGINSGPVVAGIIGATQRMEYRVVGDTVNLTARIESLNKQFGTELLISQSTKGSLVRAFSLKKFGPVAVKGKAKPVLVYEAGEA